MNYSLVKKQIIQLVMIIKYKRRIIVAVLNLRFGEDEILTKRCEEVMQLDEEIKKLSSDMIDTMYKYDGIGLASPQVGKAIRIIVYDVTYINEGAKKKPTVLINPKIISKSKSMIKVEEGCLSYPDVFYDVDRYEKVKVEYIGLDGKKRIISAKDIEAVVLQHEIDHLDGIVFLDKVGVPRSIKAKKK